MSKKVNNQTVKTENKNTETLLSFHNRRFKSGSYSMAMICIVIAVVIVLNMIVAKLPSKYINLDVSEKDLFSISEPSQKIIKNLKEDITIYFLVSEETSKNVLQVSQMLEKMEDMSSHIKVVKKDPALYPDFGNKYEATSDTVMIVESSKRYKLVNGTDVYTLANQQDYYYYGAAAEYEFNGESLITNAIHYVTTDNLPKLYTLEGHSETTLEDTIKSLVEDQNISIESLNLLSAGKVPEDADCLMIISPKQDFNETEAKAIISYLKDGGNALIFTDYSAKNRTMPNFMSVLKEYGVGLTEGMVCEGNGDYMYQVAYNIVPDVKSSDVTKELTDNNLKVIMASAQGIEKEKNVRDTVTITDLLTTSDSAYSKLNLQSSDIKKAKDDIEGPFAVGVAITESEKSSSEEGSSEDAMANSEEESDVKTKIALFTSSVLIDPSLYSNVTTNDATLFINAIGWMCDFEDSISVSSKSMSEVPLTITDAQAHRWMVVYVIVLPVIVVGLGLMITIRRRKC